MTDGPSAYDVLAFHIGTSRADDAVSILLATTPDGEGVYIAPDGTLRGLVGVETESPCPCTNPPLLIPQDDRPDPNCAYCGGSGRLPCEPRLSRWARLSTVPLSTEEIQP